MPGQIALQSKGMTPTHLHATKKMIVQGLGIAFLPRTATTDELAAGTLATTTVAGAEPLRRPIVAITRARSGPLSGPAARFLGLLESMDLPDARALS